MKRPTLVCMLFLAVAATVYGVTVSATAQADPYAPCRELLRNEASFAQLLSCVSNIPGTARSERADAYYYAIAAYKTRASTLGDWWSARWTTLVEQAGGMTDGQREMAQLLEHYQAWALDTQKLRPLELHSNGAGPGPGGGVHGTAHLQQTH